MNILDLLNEQERKFLAYHQIKKGDVFLKEGDNPHNVYFVISGIVKISSFSSHGDEELINILQQGDIFANALAFSGTHLYGDVIAMDNAVVASIDESSIIEIFSTNQAFLKAYLNILSEKTISLQMRVKLLSKRTIEERLIFYLETHNRKLKKNISTLSMILLCPRPSLSRSVSKLKREGIIGEKNHYLYLIK